MSFDENQPRAEFLAGPDEDGIDHLWNEIESLDIWREAANDPNYDIQRVNLTWRETAAHLAERGAFLGRLLVVTRDTLREHGLFASTPETGETK